jgi:hypothetical protein
MQINAKQRNMHNAHCTADGRAITLGEVVNSAGHVRINTILM